MPVERSGGGGGSAAGGLVRLFTQTLGVAAASIDTGAGGVAGGHTDLIINLYARSDSASIAVDARFNFNADVGANYDWAWVRNAAGALSAVDGHADTNWPLGQIPGTTIPANYFASVTVNIPRYDNTTGFKAGTSLSGPANDITANDRIIFTSGLWRNTGAITRIAFVLGAGNLVAGSSMTIYGTQ